MRLSATTIFALSLGACMPAPPPAPTAADVAKAQRGTFLSLVYGGNGQGEIEPCG